MRIPPERTSVILTVERNLLEKENVDKAAAEEGQNTESGTKNRFLFPLIDGLSTIST